MKVINNNNEILDSTVYWQNFSGKDGLIIESRGGSKNSVFARNVDYSKALEIILERLKKISTVSIIEIYLISRTSLSIPIQERILKVDGESKIMINTHETGALRNKISKAIRDNKANKVSKGGNSNKRILISTDLNENEWSQLVLNNSNYNFQIDDNMLEVESFNPHDIKDAMEKVSISINRRKGQVKFRKKLIKIYESKCAITQSIVLPVLQAAHIYPYNGTGTNHITNGILLRSDIHDLFDLNLIGINDKYVIVVAEELKGTEYETYNGKQIFLPKDNSKHPNKESLKSRPCPYREK